MNDASSIIIIISSSSTDDYLTSQTPAVMTQSRSSMISGSDSTTPGLTIHIYKYFRQTIARSVRVFFTRTVPRLFNAIYLWTSHHQRRRQVAMTSPSYLGLFFGPIWVSQTVVELILQVQGKEKCPLTNLLATPRPFHSQNVGCSLVLPTAGTFAAMGYSLYDCFNLRCEVVT